MKLSAKQLLFIDRLFWPLHKVEERLFLKFRKLSAHRSDSVVIFKFMGLGSLIRLASLCKQHHIDQEKITLVTFDHQKEICEVLGFSQLHFIRTTHLIHFIRDCIHLGMTIRKQPPSIIIDFERCSHAVASLRIFSAWLGRCPALSFEVNRSMSHPKLTIHPVEKITLEQLFLLGLEHVPQSRLQNDQSEVWIDSKKILININASDLLLSRRYPLSGYANIIEQLHEKNKELQFHLIGLANEFDYVNELICLTKGKPVFNRAGEWNLHQLIDEISHCAAFITGDSGPMHLAIYLGVPTIALWGPTHPIHFGYTNVSHLTSLSLAMSCSPCFAHPASKPEQACKGKIDCLKYLSPDLVVAQVNKILSNTSDKRIINRRESWRNPETKLESHLVTQSL